MKNYHISRHPSFYTIGLNYKKADAVLRGKFSLEESSMQSLLQDAKQQGIDGILATSTCNRTELHGFAQPRHGIGRLGAAIELEQRRGQRWRWAWPQ